MVRNSGKRDINGQRKENETRDKVEEDVDGLFKLPLAEFISARKALAAQLKHAGQGNDAERVKALGKPSISAWAVNQLYWNHRDAFDQLISTGERFRQVQTSSRAGKITDMREALDARREALSQLSRLATELLQDAGHNPTWDMMGRITTTLEALSAYGSLPDTPPAGRLTHDVDPPGFESLASGFPSAGMTDRTQQPPRITSSRKTVNTTTNTQQGSTTADVRQLKETRQARIAAAKLSLQNAKRALTESRARAQSAQAQQKKANAEAKEAEKQKREAEQRFEKATAVLEDASHRARSIAANVVEALKAVEDAERIVEKATKELESVFRQSP